MKKRVLRLVAAIMAAVMTVVSLNPDSAVSFVRARAEETGTYNGGNASDKDGSNADGEGKSGTTETGLYETEEGIIYLGELTERREENVKHYLHPVRQQTSITFMIILEDLKELQIPGPATDMSMIPWDV